MALVGSIAAILLAMGRTPICTCGYVEFWHGTANDFRVVLSISRTGTRSRTLFTASCSTWRSGRSVGRALPLGLGFLIALMLEGAWEIVENTNLIIERYRATAIALDYFGDSVINSVSDVLFMALGFWLARIWPVWSTVVAGIAMEVFVGYWIRDNLALNIIMLIHPFDAINRWQAGPCT